MKTKPTKTLFLPAIAACLCLLLADAAHAGQRRILAHGDPQHLWVASITQAHDDQETYWQTNLRWRDFGQTDYSPLPTQAARAVSLASAKGGDVVLVMDDGWWYLVDADGSRLGPALPANAKMLAAANDQDVLWALGLWQPPIPATAATAPQLPPPDLPANLDSAATAPALSPLLPPRLAVYRQSASGGWEPGLAIPQNLNSNPDDLSMTIVNQLPVVAWVDSDGAIQVIALGPDHIWSPPLKVPPPPGLDDFKLINLGGKPALWLLQSQKDRQGNSIGPFTGGVLCHGDDFKSRTQLQVSGMPANAGVPETVATAFNQLLLIAQDRDGKWYDQINRPDGAAEHPAVGTPSAPPQPIDLQPWIAAAIAVVLLAIVAALVKRRGGAAANLPPSDAKFELAPLHLRLAAGTIDLSPLIAVCYVLRQLNGKDPALWVDPAAGWLLALAAATFILHVLAAELICSQSLGKMMFNLHVAALDGKPPQPIAILVRNVLRLLDLALLPLMAVLFSPLRQRIGDLAAGTVVLVQQTPEQERSTTEE